MEYIVGISFLVITLLIALFIQAYSSKKIKSNKLGIFLILGSFTAGLFILFYSLSLI
ncbi:MAG: hypothetical protein J0L87_08410 [Bacteroidetes bacterium]|nr:hypothetical protein [Bacteroidota bacterium]